MNRLQTRSYGHRAFLALVLAVALSVALGACRTVTHEDNAPVEQQYDEVKSETGSRATYAFPNAEQAYLSSASAKASFDGSASPMSDSTAYGGFNVNGQPGRQGTYAAAFYFPEGTLSGSQPGQRADLDVMRWEGDEDFGGVRIGSDHKARLIRGGRDSGMDTMVEPIDQSFELKEGCWNFITVIQKLSREPSDSPRHATNELYLNGRKIIDSHKPNAFSSQSGVTKIRFGIPYIDAMAQGNSSFDFYVDNASIARTTGDFSLGNTCSPPKPNILFIVTDDQRADDTMHQMPNTLKWFRDGGVEDGQVIAGGTEFAEGYATTPLCCPARASILSGHFAHNHGVRRNHEFDALSSDVQIQRYLRDGGYQTGIVGKYLNEWPTYKDPPGFDEWWIFSGGYQALINNNGTMEPPGNDTTTYTTNYVRNAARDFIDHTETNDSEPWFLYVAPTAPHSAGAYPYAVMSDPDPTWRWGTSKFPRCDNNPMNLSPCLPSVAPVPSRSEGAPGDNPIGDKPSWVQDWGDGHKILFSDSTNRDGSLRDQSLRTLRSADDMVQSVFEKLRERGEERDTLAIFVSDNGFMWREHGVAANETPTGVCAQGSHCGLFGKDKPYTEAIKIPYFMRWPANPAVPRQHIDGSGYVANIDLAPTAVAASGVSAPQMDGRSLLDRRNPRYEILTEDWDTDGAGTWASLRGGWGKNYYHYIEYYERDGITPRPEEVLPIEQPYLREYYDLANDPYELNNLFRDGDPQTPDPTLVAELTDRLAKYRLCAGADCPPSPPSSTSDTDPPRVWITSHPAGAVVDGTVGFTARASDNLGVAGVEFYLDDDPDGNLDDDQPLGGQEIDEFDQFISDKWNASSAALGDYEVNVLTRDAAGNEATAEIPVNVQRYDVKALNGSGTKGRIDNGDRVTYYFERPMAPGVFLPNWMNGTVPQPVTVRISPDEVLHRYNDVLRVDDSPALGSVDLGRPDYWGLRLNPVVDALFPSSTMAMSANGQTLTVTLGGGNQTTTAVGGGRRLIWWPASGVCSHVTPACPVTESGVSPKGEGNGDF